MTVVSIRCQECDEVKREEKMAGIQVCKECSGGDTPDSPDEDNSEDQSVSNEGGVSEEEIADESDNTPTDDAEDDETTESAERDKKPLEESFNEQDPLEW